MTLEVNGIAAFLSTDDASPSLLIKALGAMAHRAWAGFSLLSPNVGFVKGLEGVVPEGSKGALGGCLSDPASGQGELLLHGRVFNEDEGLERVHGLLLSHAYEEATARMAEWDGEFAFARVADDSIIVARDPLGTKPLYVGRKGGAVGVASETGALKSAGFDLTAPLPVGVVGRVKLQGESLMRYARLLPSRTTEISKEGAIDRLLQLLDEGVKRRLKGRKRVAVAFSGGTDSSLLALLASRYSDTKLVTVGLRGASDAKAVRAAALLGLEVESCPVDPASIATELASFKEFLGREGAMDLSIGMALSLAARRARELGCGEMILGQLADELFGGYARYLRLLAREGEGPTRGSMLRDVREADERTFARDEKALSPFAHQLLPYSCYDFVRLALSLPIEFKLNPETKERKIALREVCVRAGVPEEIAREPKKAIQYSTGFERVIRRISAREIQDARSSFTRPLA